MTRGKFIVIEGTDGSGKAEQTKKLVARLQNAGFPVQTFDFPQYGEPSAHFVERYLRGEYGTAAAVGPHKASVFYAVDRFDVGLRIAEWLKEGKIIISNRFVVSNMAHQGSKIDDPDKLEKFFGWLEEFEHSILDIPRPNLNIILHMPSDVAYELIGQKKEREYLRGKKRDIHEEDRDHLKRAEKVYLKIAEMFPKDFRLIECFYGGRLLSIDEIHEKIWLTILPLLA